MNQQLVLEIPVEGAPEPELWWRCNDQDVQTSITDEGQVKVKSSSNVAKMMFIPAKRHHCGKYMLMAKNKWGEDSAEVQIEVKGKPSMPTGPLKVSEVTKKGCLLQWGPPADNGGHEITHYEVEKMDVNSGQWLPIKNVKSFSLDVTNLVEGKSYKFLVRAVNQDGDSPDLETEEGIMAKNPFDPPGKTILQRFLFILLRFNMTVDIHKHITTAYICSLKVHLQSPKLRTGAKILLNLSGRLQR